MGLSRKDTFFLKESRYLVQGKAVLSLGNPFFEKSSVIGLLTSQQIRECFSLPRNQRSTWLFMEVFGAKSFDILDVSSDEGANVIFDLNSDKTPSELIRYYEFVLDCGTQEHIFDNSNFLRNVFAMLDTNGIYFFNVPAHGMLEHGFRQYSPTFFYDLCAQNQRLLRLFHLSLFHPPNSEGIDLFDLYSKLDPVDFKAVASPLVSALSSSERFGVFTGFLINLYNRLPRPVALIGVICKISEGELKFSVTQCIYKRYPLRDVLPDKRINSKPSGPLFMGPKIKNFALIFPMPIVLKITLIKLFVKLKKIW